MVFSHRVSFSRRVTFSRRSFLLSTVGLAAATFVSKPAKAETFPERPIRFVVPFPAGGVSDISRLLDRVATSPSTEAATQEMLHASYADLQDQTLAYLKHEYLH